MLTFYSVLSSFATERDASMSATVALTEKLEPHKFQCLVHTACEAQKCEQSIEIYKFLNFASVRCIARRITLWKGFKLTHLSFGQGMGKNVVLCWCFMALRLFSGHFGRGQLIYPHCSWANLPGSLPVLSADSFTYNWQLPIFNQQKGENGGRNYFMTKLPEIILL